MAQNDTEIEIKLPLDESTFLRIQQQLRNSANFVKNDREVDEYFTPVHRNFVEPKFPSEWLRVRKRGDAALLTYKHFYPEGSEIQTHCDEFETEIKSGKQLQKILQALDFKALVTVDKTRETYRTDDFEFALDNVKDLGHFIEIEALKVFGDVASTREKLFETAKQLGIDIADFEKRGYPFMLMKKKGLLK